MGRWAKRTALEWEAIFKAQTASGKTASKFCREQSIQYKEFLYFRKKLRSNNKYRAEPIEASGMVTPANRRAGFVPVRIENGSVPCMSMGCAMRLKFPRGLIVESDGLLPPSWVTKAAELWLGMGE